uniref:Stathmin domain-containing protein 1 n=1 Tax=Phallusia mammillata TaxID=59560 RepID=A0A6F9DT85_9ASCI|nr:stathmin domain-containing protein 1 [Phallusia mammillata]
MGCGQSKDAVKAIQMQDGEVRSKSAKSKKIKVASSDLTVADDSNAVQIGKSTSAKSRDSGYQEDYGKNDINDIITEESDPNRIKDVESLSRPKTPIGSQFNPKSAGRERMRSRAILQELEAEGLISGSKVEKGGTAFEVSVGPLQPLEPLAPIRRPPPRLERMKSEKKILTKAELEKKIHEADERRMQTMERKKSRLAMQIARDQEIAKKMKNTNRDEIDFADNVDNVAKPASAGAPDYGQGEHTGLSNNKQHPPRASVFETDSMSSLDEVGTPLGGGVSSTDDFFGAARRSRNNSLSRTSVNA